MIKKYIEIANNSINEKNYVVFPEEVFEKISLQDANEIVRSIDINTLMLLPQKEIDFFEWLKREDKAIWDDLWNDGENQAYLVSISFLPLLIYSSNFNGFPICDLMDNDNYYFTISMMNADHSQTVLEAAKGRFSNQQKLDLHHILALEIVFNSIDIWHFAYKYGISIDNAKMALDILVQDKAIYHYKKTEDVARFINF